MIFDQVKEAISKRTQSSALDTRSHFVQVHWSQNLRLNHLLWPQNNQNLKLKRFKFAAQRLLQQLPNQKMWCEATLKKFELNLVSFRTCFRGVSLSFYLFLSLCLSSLSLFLSLSFFLSRSPLALFLLPLSLLSLSFCLSGKHDSKNRTKLILPTSSFQTMFFSVSLFAKELSEAEQFLLSNLNRILNKFCIYWIRTHGLGLFSPPWKRTRICLFFIQDTTWRLHLFLTVGKAHHHCNPCLPSNYLRHIRRWTKSLRQITTAMATAGWISDRCSTALSYSSLSLSCACCEKEKGVHPINTHREKGICKNALSFGHQAGSNDNKTIPFHDREVSFCHCSGWI